MCLLYNSFCSLGNLYASFYSHGQCRIIKIDKQTTSLYHAFSKALGDTYVVVHSSGEFMVVKRGE